MPTRRTLLLATAAAGAATAAGVGIWALQPPDTSDLVLDDSLPDEQRRAALRAHLRERFWYLDIPDTTLDGFLAALEEHSKLPTKSSRLSALRKKFLLSTDFFLKDADETRPIAFVAWHDPYVTPCWNPLTKGVPS